MRLQRPDQSANKTSKGRSNTSKANRRKHKIIAQPSSGPASGDVSKKAGTPRVGKCVPLYPSTASGDVSRKAGTPRVGLSGDVSKKTGTARTPASGDVSKKGGTRRDAQCVPLHQKRPHPASTNADRSTKPKPQPPSSGPPSSQRPSSQPPSSQPLSQEPTDEVTTPDATVTAVASIFKNLSTIGGAREQRVKYEHAMLRYGHWDYVKLRVYAYLGVVLCASLLSNYILILYAIFVYDTVSEEGRPFCNCSVSSAYKTARIELGKVDPSSRLVYWKMIAGILIGLFSPLMERFIGRRHCIVLFLALNGVWAGIVSTSSPTSTATKVLTDVAMFGLCLGDTFVVYSCAVSLIESLPFHLRVLAPLTIPIANAIGTVFCLLLFETFALQNVCYAAIVLYVVGMGIAFFATEDSLCHLIIRNRLEKVQKHETELCEREGGDSKIHKRIAKKIYEDICFLDTDELSIFYFLRRFFKSLVVLETILACVFAITAGLHDFEMYQLGAEQFASVYVIVCGKLLAFLITSAVMLMTRNTHRVKVLSLLQCWILFLLAMKKCMVKFEKANVCSQHLFVGRSQFLFVFLLSSLVDGLVMALQTTLFLNFLEAAPSILRMTSVGFIMIPIHVVKVVAFQLFGIGGMKNLLDFSFVYLFHLIVGVVALLRMADNVPFSLYLIDLLPLSDRPSYCSTRRAGRGEEESADQTTMRGGSVMQARIPDPKEPIITP